MTKQATLYRMKTAEHICPFGLKSKHLLQQQGFEVSDHLLTSRAQTDEFKQRLHSYEQKRAYRETLRLLD